MTDNMEIYEKVREVPEDAKKTIGGGKLKGFTDINPMWRIKTLTQLFGPCGFGWYFNIVEHWIDEGADEITANVIIELFVKYEDKWSKPIAGIGGAKLVASEKNGKATSDECFKMATTDAISVACKSLGIGANVYWDKDATKYTKEEAEEKKEEKKDDAGKQVISTTKAVALKKRCEDEGVSVQELCNKYTVKDISLLTEYQYANINQFWDKVKEVCRQAR